MVFVFSQNTEQNEIYVDWENPKNFEKYNVKKVSVYSKDVKKNGKIKKDSLLLSITVYNKNMATLNRINHKLMDGIYNSGNHHEFIYVENKYIFDSLILKRVQQTKPIINKNKIEFVSFIELFKYDELNRLILEKKYSEANEYELSKKDTMMHYRSDSYPKINEYEYDSKNRVIKKYFTRDSSIYHINSYNEKKITSYKSCSYCGEKYLEQVWKYDEDKLLEWTTYTYKSEKHTKRNYSYDENQNLIKQIDSTGWYLGKPSLSSIKEIRYDDNQKIEIKTTLDENSYFKKETKKFVGKQLVYEFLEAEYPEYNIETTYTHTENSIKKTTNRFKDGITIEEYFFNKNGLLIEEKSYLNHILIECKEYYYE
jgi:hypothetical protein